MQENASETSSRRAAPASRGSSSARLHAPVRDSYDALAASYDTRWRRYIEATSALALEGMATKPGDRVLNIACGTGELERRLVQRYPQIRLTGTDLSLTMLRRAVSKSLHVDWLSAVSTQLPLAAGVFDHVLCVNAFHYFRQPQESLLEMRRTLRPGGTLTLVDWCDDYWSCKLCGVWLRVTDKAFHRTYSLSACQGLVEQTGFQVVSAQRQRIDWLWGLMRLVCRS
jgi:ubiquinone/menaquinone biosynthesis C-methylase UbiE